MKARNKIRVIPKKQVRDIEAGDIIRLNGVWRLVTNVEPHERDAYLVVFTHDPQYGSARWVRSVFDELGVKADA